MSTVDRIREQLTREDGVGSDAMESLALAYGFEVSQLNDRLSKCTNLLRKGLRSEAIQLANIRPNLFDWSASLDFPEVDDWLEILLFYQIVLPQRLNRDAVQQLQEAMVEEQPLEELLRQHRRLAIGKAPLSWRLKVLRAIANLDTGNGMWVEDLELWEKARLSEIPKALNRSIKDEDVDGCSKLAMELNQKNWTVQPPQELVAAANSATNRFEFTALCKELELVGKSLYDSFCAQDESECRLFGTQWNNLTAQLKAPLPKPIFEAAEPALLWLADLDDQNQKADSHQRAVETLVSKLDEGSSLMEIQKAYHAASSYSQDLDPTLESRYRSVTSELSLTAKRRTFLSVVGIASAALLAALAFGVWQWQSLKQAELMASLNTMQQLLEGRKLLEAKKFVDSLQTTKPGVAKSTEMIALAAELTGQLQTEADRADSFESYVKAADNQAPDRIDLANLVRAEELAATESEKEKVYRIRRRRQEYDRTQQDAQFAQLSSSLTTFVGDLSAIESKSKDELTAQDFEQLLNRHSDLMRQYPNVGSAGDTLLETVRKRLTGLRDSHSKLMLKQQNELAALTAIRRAASLEVFRQALDSYHTANPDSAISAEFKEAASEADNWTIVNDWNSFVSHVGAFGQGPTPELALKLEEELKKLKSIVEDCPALARCPDLEARIASVARRPEILNTLESSLDRNLISALVTLHGQVQSNTDQSVRVFAYFNQIDGKHKELENASARSGSGLEVIAGADGTVKLLSFRGPVKVVDQPKNLYAELVSTLRLRSADIVKEWESPLLLMINDIMKRPQVDSAVKEMLIVEVLEAATEGSYFLNSKLNETLVLLKQKRLRDTRWFDPQVGRDGLDPQMETRLRTSLGEAYRDIASSHSPIAKLADSKLTWVGSIQHDDNGQMQAWLSSIPSNSGSLIVVRPSTAPGLLRMEEAGQLTNGLAKLNAPSPSLMAGRPLFFMPND